MTSLSRKLAGGVALLSLSTAAMAHTGHGTHGFFAGLEHPLGLDHLLAMVAVGVWSAAALPARRQWMGPAAFLAALTVGAALGVAGFGLPGVETGIAASVVMFGLMLAFARRLPAAAGLALTAGAAALHGLAHGAELPQGATFAAYAAGFLATTALLHVGGLGLGQSLDRAKAWVWRALGASVGMAGLALLVRA